MQGCEPWPKHSGIGQFRGLCDDATFQDLCPGPLAHEKGFQSIAFPLIGSGSGWFNQKRARAIMEDELGKLEYRMEARLVVFKRACDVSSSSGTKASPQAAVTPCHHVLSTR